MSFQINKYTDFIILGCKIYNQLIIFLADGIYDELTNKEILIIIWTCFFNLNTKDTSKEIIVEKICNEIMMKSIEKCSNDNLSLIFIAFDNFFNNKENLENLINRIKHLNCNRMII